MASFDNEVLLLSPVCGSVDITAVEHHLESTPGAFRDPIDPLVWILSAHPQEIENLRRERVEHPTEYPLGLARVVTSSKNVVVYPDYSTGRSRQFVTWLLTQGPCALEVRGEVIGQVATPSDIYASADTWKDPDALADPTEMPPRTGMIVSMARDLDGLLEHVEIHDSGIMSYEQLRPVDDPQKTYRRLNPEFLARWLELIKRLPFDGDVRGPDGDYVDPVLISAETPTYTIGIPKIDAARPTEAYQEFIGLVNGWATALRGDRAAMPPGLLPYP